MKKRGSAIAIVLIITTFLIILGTALSSYVVNNTKLNAGYNDIIDYDLAAKSGVNIIKEDIITKSEEEFSTINDIEIYLEKINSENFSDSPIIKKVVEDYKGNGIVLDLNLSLNEDSSKIKIESQAYNEKNESIKKVENQNIILAIGDVEGEELPDDNGKVEDDILSKSLGGNKLHLTVAGAADFSTTTIRGPKEEIHINVAGEQAEAQIEDAPIQIPVYNFEKPEKIEISSIDELTALATNDESVKDGVRSIKLSNTQVYLVNTDELLIDTNNSSFTMHSIIILASDKVTVETGNFALSRSLILANEIYINTQTYAIQGAPESGLFGPILDSDREFLDEELKKYAPDYNGKFIIPENMWKYGRNYVVGDIVIYTKDQQWYECIGMHTSGEPWVPGTASGTAFWKPTTKP